jgi:hypothetical protein
VDEDPGDRRKEEEGRGQSREEEGNMAGEERDKL